jgi:hypothetical protein
MIGDATLPAVAGNFSLHHHVQDSSWAHASSYTINKRALFLGVKRPACESEKSPLFRDEVENAWGYTSTPPIRFHGVVSVKAQGQFYL